MSRIKVNSKQARALGIPVPPKKRRPKGDVSDEYRRAIFRRLCISHGLPEPIPEFQFAPPRKWKFDWLFNPIAGLMIALEIQGGIWTGGRHVRGAALLGEMEKLNEAAIRGYRVLYATPEQVTTGEIFPVLRRALGLNP